MDQDFAPIIRVQAEDFDVAAEIAALRTSGADIGAIVSFTGICRAEGGRLEGLELEHYPKMAEKEIERVARQAVQRWPLTGVTLIHRHGRIAAGENIVLVITASSHRQAAFDAASFLMDFLKTRAPFWKKEIAQGAQAGSWVEAKLEDDNAARRWEDDRTGRTAGSEQAPKRS